MSSLTKHELIGVGQIFCLQIQFLKIRKAFVSFLGILNIFTLRFIRAMYVPSENKSRQFSLFGQRSGRSATSNKSDGGI